MLHSAEKPLDGVFADHRSVSAAEITSGLDSDSVRRAEQGVIAFPK
jgi:hypothetical protein